MMPKVTVSGFEQYLKKLDNLEKSGERFLKAAVYEGAKITTDAVRTSITALPIDQKRGFPHNPRHGVTWKEKAGLLNGLGVSSIENEKGYINAKIGFNGYNDDKTKKWPKGKPIVMIARALESGTSFSLRTPFVGPAVRRVSSSAKKAMIEKFENEVDKIIKE